MNAKQKANGSTPRQPKKALSPRPYPRVSLEVAVTVPLALKEQNGGNPWPLAEVAKAIRVSHRDSKFVYILAASKKYGLTEGEVNIHGRGEVTLTDLGRGLVYSGDPTEELTLKRHAFLNVEIFRAVLDYYKGSNLPEMKYLGNTLKSKFDLPAEYHDEFSRVFRENCTYLGIKEGLSGDVDSPTAEEARSSAVEGAITVAEAPGKASVCFVIIPFGERTEKYQKGFFGEVLNSLVIPAARSAGFEVRTANRQGSEIIHSTIINEVLDADICVCDLTEHNPNVLFELGIRLAHNKPVALIHAEGTAFVFDVGNLLRIYSYKSALWRTSLEKDIPDLTAHIKSTWENRSSAESYFSLLRRGPGS